MKYDIKTKIVKYTEPNQKGLQLVMLRLQKHKHKKMQAAVCANYAKTIKNYSMEDKTELHLNNFQRQMRIDQKSNKAIILHPFHVHMFF